MEAREEMLLDWAAEQREPDRVYRFISTQVSYQKEMGCEKFYSGCTCSDCQELTNYFNEDF